MVTIDKVGRHMTPAICETTAVRHADCGPCTLTMAGRAAVSPAGLRAMIGDYPDAMPPDIVVWKFTRATPVRFDHGRVPAPADVAVRKA
jgi:hypothetical protein